MTHCRAWKVAIMTAVEGDGETVGAASPTFRPPGAGYQTPRGAHYGHLDAEGGLTVAA